MHRQIPVLNEKDVERFFVKVKKTNTCWIWTASKTKNGYGAFGIRNIMYYTHRVSYFIKHGKISKILSIDHLCHNRICVNPNHLQEVTQKENTIRGDTGLHHKIKTHCPNGHSYDRKTKIGGRFCSICKSKNDKKYKDKLRALLS